MDVPVPDGDILLTPSLKWLWSNRVSPMRDLLLYFDGGCFPNPGGRGNWAFIVKESDGSEHFSDRGDLPAGPTTTNNVAEWTALVAGLEWLAKRPTEYGGVTVRGDSRMVIQQALGEWKVKKPHLKPFAAEASRLLNQIGRGRVFFEWVRRDLNQDCDSLAHREDGVLK